MHMYKVITSKAKGFDEGRLTSHLRIKTLMEKIMRRAMEREPLFDAYFSNSVTGESGELRIELADSTRYEMRVFMKNFPLPDSFQVHKARITV